MRKRFDILLLVFAIGSATLADEPAKKNPPELKVGQELPFLVANFVSGPHKGHCGCPSAIIGNHDARAVVIWTKTADATVVELAAAFEGKAVDGNRKQAYLIAFDTPEEKLAAETKSEGWKGVTVGKSNHGSELEFKRRGIDVKATYVVFLTERKQIKQMWAFTASELTKEKSAAIVNEANEFLKAGSLKK